MLLLVDDDLRFEIIPDVLAAISEYAMHKLFLSNAQTRYVYVVFAFNLVAVKLVLVVCAILVHEPPLRTNTL